MGSGCLCCWSRSHDAPSLNPPRLKPLTQWPFVCNKNPPETLLLNIANLPLLGHGQYETMPSCKTLNSCSPSENMRHQKSTIKSQRNALLIAAALVFYWLLYSVTKLIDRVEQLQFQIKRSTKNDWHFARALSLEITSNLCLETA